MPILDPFEDAVQFYRGASSLASMFVVGRNIAQNVNSGAWAAIQWDTQTYDELGEVAIVNPWTFVPQVAGYYYFYASCTILALNVGDVFEMEFNLNGFQSINYRRRTAHALNENVSLNVAGIRHLTPTDALYVEVQHNFGAPRAISGNQYESSWMGYRIR